MKGDVPFPIVPMCVQNPRVVSDVYVRVSISTALTFKYNLSFSLVCCLLPTRKQFFSLSCLSVCVETASKPRQLKRLKSIALKFHFKGKSYFLLPPPVSIKPLPLNYLVFFFLNQKKTWPPSLSCCSTVTDLSLIRQVKKNDPWNWRCYQCCQQNSERLSACPLPFLFFLYKAQVCRRFD